MTFVPVVSNYHTILPRHVDYVDACKKSKGNDAYRYFQYKQPLKRVFSLVKNSTRRRGIYPLARPARSFAPHRQPACLALDIGREGRRHSQRSLEPVIQSGGLSDWFEKAKPARTDRSVRAEIR
jgi:hypothetical protein